MRQGVIEGSVKGRDLIARHGGGVRSQETGGEGGLCYGEVMGRHCDRGIMFGRSKYRAQNGVNLGSSGPLIALSHVIRTYSVLMKHIMLACS